MYAVMTVGNTDRYTVVTEDQFNKIDPNDILLSLKLIGNDLPDWIKDKQVCQHIHL